MALLVERGIVTGQKAERFKMQDLQPTLQMLEMLLDPESEQHEPEPAGEPQKVREHERRPHGRAPLPEHLPRVQTELLPPEVQHDGLDLFVRVGEAVREVLERRPASMVAVRIVLRSRSPRAAGNSGRRCAIRHERYLGSRLGHSIRCLMIRRLSA